MKHTLIRVSGFALLLAALDGPGAARAQTEDLSFCKGHGYPHVVSDVLIAIRNSDGLPSAFDLALGLDGRNPIKVKQRKLDDPDTWRGEARDNFFLNEIDLQPRIPGFTVSGPGRCQYQVIQAEGIKRCAAKYEFSVRSIKVALQTEPPEATVRLMADAELSQSLDKECVPPP